MENKKAKPQVDIAQNQIIDEAYNLYRNKVLSNPQACISALKQALPLLNRQTDLKSATYVYLALANCYKLTEDYTNALEYYTEAIYMARQGSIDWAYAEALEQAQIVCTNMNDHAAACSYALELNRWLKAQLSRRNTNNHLWSSQSPDTDNHLQHIEKQRSIIERQHSELQRFGYIVAHDLKEPLHIVSGFSSLINYKFQHLFTPELKELFGYLSGGVKQLHEKLDDLLDYVHIDPNPTKELVSAEAAVNKVKSMFTSRIQELNAQITLLNTENQAVFTNPAMLISLLYRLIDNALKFTHQQTPKITISISQQEGETLIAIADNGIGIEPEYHERIFQIFTQLNRQQDAGTGMGLAICRKIAEAQGGKIWVNSAPNTGSTFFVALPQKSNVH